MDIKSKDNLKVFSEIYLSDDFDINKSFEFITTAKQTDWRYGDFEYTKKELEEMADNFNSDVLGLEIAVDINHSMDKKAYAWIKPKSMEVRKSSKLKDHYSLFAQLYRFTPEGEDLIKTGAYRYFSLEIVNKFEKFIGKTKKVFKNVIAGIALTNCPVIKDMSPTYSQVNNNLSFNSKNMDPFKILLSSLQDKKTVTNSEKEILQKMFVSLSEEEQAEVKEEVEKIEETKTEEEIKAEEEKVIAEKEAKEKEEKENEEKQKNLSETERKFAEQAKELAQIKEERKIEKVEGQLNTFMLSETNGKGFVADKKEDVKSFLLSLSEDQSKTFSSLFKEIKSVDLSVSGSSSSNENLESDELLDKKAREYAEKNKVSYSQALKEVA